MPCSAPVRGKTDLINPWEPITDNDPCGVKKLIRAGVIPPLSDNPLANWPLGDGGANCADLLTHPGVYVGNTSPIDGPFPGSVGRRFIAHSTALGSDCAQIPAPSADLNMTDVFTIMFWVRVLQQGLSGDFYRQYVFGKPFNHIIRLVGSAGGFPITVELYGSGGVTLPSMAVIQQNRWHHVAVAKNSATACKIYVDGQDVSGAVVNAVHSNSANQPVYIGNYSGVWGLTGDMYDVRIFNQYLSQARIQEYALGKDASADNLCPGHYAMKYGALSGPGAMIAQEP